MSPPRLADRLLAFICAPHRLEEVQGDMHEEFAYQVQRVGERRARWRYWRDVLGFVKPRFISRPNPIYSTPTATDMLGNYVKIAFRQLWRHRLFSLINIMGLTVGLAVSTFITLYVWHEFHYDRFEPFADRTYRILTTAKFGGDEVFMTGLHESFGREIKRQLPEVQEVVRVSQGGGTVTLQSDASHQFKEPAVAYADASLLPTMGFTLLNGANPKTALTEPGHIVINRDIALKYFNSTDVVGKTLYYNRQYPLTVAGVMDDFPTNSYFGTRAFISLSSMPTLGPSTKSMFEGSGFLETFLVLRPDANARAIGTKLKAISKNVMFHDETATYSLEQLSSLHLVQRGDTNPKQPLYVFLTIALAILLLAVINYISLTTARATQRSREVGIRKAIGGLRRELIGQFFIESFLTTTLAFGLAILLVVGLLPVVKPLLQLPLDNRVFRQPIYWLVMGSLWLVCAVLAGSYPALLVSGFRPQDALKGLGGPGLRGAASVRRVFTTVQFAGSIGLLICSLVIYAQMRYLHTRQIGIDRTQVVALTIDTGMKNEFRPLRDAVRQWAGPGRVATTNTALFTFNMMTYFAQTKAKKQIMVNSMTVDTAFFRTMGVRWDQAPDGWQKRIIGNELVIYNQTLMTEANVSRKDRRSELFEGERVDGVVADFHNRSLHQGVMPLRISVVNDTSRAVVANGGYLLVRLDPHTDITAALAHLRQLYAQHRPTSPFDFYFLDDAYAKLYETETRLARLFNVFTLLALLVACLGLLGLVTFAVEARTKEIGIRKVLGASVINVVTLLSKDSLKLVLIAFVIASPLAWWAMHQWLQDFAYRIDIQWWVFALAGGLTTAIALLTVSFQSIKAALMNPVKSLRSE